MAWFDRMKTGTKMIGAFVLAGILSGIAGYISTHQFPAFLVFCFVFLGTILSILISSSVSRQHERISQTAFQIAEGNAQPSLCPEQAGSWPMLCIKSTRGKRNWPMQQAELRKEIFP
jgi:hypothetical protein